MIALPHGGACLSSPRVLMQPGGTSPGLGWNAILFLCAYFRFRSIGAAEMWN